MKTIKMNKINRKAISKKLLAMIVAGTMLASSILPAFANEGAEEANLSLIDQIA